MTLKESGRADHDEPTNKDEPHTHQFPQMTVYDSLSLSGVDFGLFVNSTCGLRINGTVIPCAQPELDPGGIDPDVLLSGVARHRDKFFSQRHFYERAAAGTLPAFSFVYPPVQACDHPCHDMAKGERLLKDICACRFPAVPVPMLTFRRCADEAVRAGPKWEKTLLLVAYDDAGGFYDHIVPPHEGVPNDEAACNIRDHPGMANTSCAGAAKALGPFDFRRLGLRSTAMIISPWIAKGSVIQAPQGPYATSQWEHSSIPATAKTLFNLTGFLTQRVRPKLPTADKTKSTPSLC